MNLRIPCAILFILLLIYICSILLVDNMTPINNLKIKYNKPDVIYPEVFIPTLDLKTTELNKQPLYFENQLYSMDKYPYVGNKQNCMNDSDCSQITSECTHGTCTFKNPHKTLFDINY